MYHSPEEKICFYWNIEIEYINIFLHILKLLLDESIELHIYE